MLYKKIILLMTCIFYINVYCSSQRIAPDLLGFGAEQKKPVTPVINNNVFTTDELKLIRDYAEILYQRTTPDDIIIFVGRSPWIFSYYWEYKKYDRQFYLASFSGKPYDEVTYPKEFLNPSDEEINKLMKTLLFPTKEAAISHHQWRVKNGFVEGGKIMGPTKTQLEKYKTYLGSVKPQDAGGLNIVSKNGLATELEQSSDKKRTILVDYTVTGNGIAHFAQILLDLKLLNKSSSVVFEISNESYSQEIMDKFDYAARNTIYQRRFPFYYKINACSLQTLAQNLEIKSCLSSKFGKWEFSMPGLGKYPLELWATVNPQEFEETENIDNVRKNAKEIWSQL